MSVRRVLIMAGGTGGHVFPALAVAQVLSQQNIQLHWLGTQQGLEAHWVPLSNIPITYIPVAGLRKKGWRSWVKAPWVLIRAVRAAYRAIRSFNPDVVLGFGGFASGPGGLAAWLRRVPLVVHEQNSIPGLTNRFLSYLADYTLTGFPNAFSPGKKIFYVGNPLRASLSNLPEPSQRWKSKTHLRLRLLVLGGSLGAQALNRTLPQAVALFPDSEKPEIWHQTGEKHLESAMQGYREAKVQVRLDSFIEDMSAAYRWADLIVCRAGALTLAELASVGLGSVLIPYPHAVDNHQTYNSRFLVAAGAAVLLQESQLTPESLKTVLEPFIFNKEKCLEMAVSARKLGTPSAAEEVSRYCLLAGENRHGS